jgi:hypothetical protein
MKRNLLQLAFGAAMGAMLTVGAQAAVPCHTLASATMRAADRTGKDVGKGVERGAADTGKALRTAGRDTAHYSERGVTKVARLAAKAVRA